MNKFEMYIKKEIKDVKPAPYEYANMLELARNPKVEEVYTFILCENDKLNWITKNSEEMEEFAGIEIGDIIFNGELLSKDKIGLEIREFFLYITNEIMETARYYKREYSNLLQNGGLYSGSEEHAGFITSMFQTAAKFLEEYITAIPNELPKEERKPQVPC